MHSESFSERPKTVEFRQGNDRQWNDAIGQLGAHQAGTAAKSCPGKITGCYGKVREVSRKSTKVRTDQARKSAMLRIVTGKTNFFDKGTRKRRRQEWNEPNGSQKRGNKSEGTGIITRTWAEATKENA